MVVSFVRFPTNKTTAVVIPVVPRSEQDIDFRAEKFLEELEADEEVKLKSNKSKKKDTCTYWMEGLLRAVIKNIPKGEENAIKRPDLFRKCGLHIYDINNWLAWVLIRHIREREDVGMTHRNGREAYYIKDSTEN